MSNYLKKEYNNKDVNILCCFQRYLKKKNNLKKSGYLVDKPFDYDPEKYGYIKTHNHFLDVGVYYKYGPVYIIY